MTVHERKVLLAFKAEAITKAVTDWMLGRDNLDKRLTEEDRKDLFDTIHEALC
jgi:hypothetical protein